MQFDMTFEDWYDPKAEPSQEVFTFLQKKRNKFILVAMEASNLKIKIKRLQDDWTNQVHQSYKKLWWIAIQWFWSFEDNWLAQLTQNTPK